MKSAAAGVHSGSGNPRLKIGQVAATVGVSASVIRAWERLGLLRPRRTRSQYRLYSPDDVRLLKRARFLRRERGMNAPAILELLKGKGLSSASSGAGERSPAVGPLLRRLRTRRGLSLNDVAEEIGVSIGFLSALERSQMSASVSTLRKLARFYKIKILDLFQPSRSNPNLVRPGERKVLDAGPGVRMELLAWGNAVMEPHLFRIAARASSGEAYSHQGEEFLYVLQGELDISLDGKGFRLRGGDSFYFDSATPHRWANPGNRETRVLWINTPPTF